MCQFKVLWITIIFLLYVGYPGSVHDAHDLANSSVYEKINDGKLFCRPVQDEIRLFLVGDSSYPCTSTVANETISTLGSIVSTEKLQNAFE